MSNLQLSLLKIKVLFNNLLLFIRFVKTLRIASTRGTKTLIVKLRILKYFEKK